MVGNLKARPVPRLGLKNDLCCAMICVYAHRQGNDEKYLRYLVHLKFPDNMPMHLVSLEGILREIQVEVIKRPVCFFANRENILSHSFPQNYLIGR